METNIKRRISYDYFRDSFNNMPCFCLDEIRTWRPDFQNDRLTDWVKNGKLYRLRKNLYTFKENIVIPSIELYFANKIYIPSYISIHTALKFYGIIPDEVFTITSVSPNKTKNFKNRFGNYVYYNISEKYYFGYKIYITDDKRFAITMATPEKAIIDLLHLYPQYKNEKDFIDLRFDEDFMKEEFKKDLMLEYLELIESKTLEKRCKMLVEVYGVK